MIVFEAGGAPAVRAGEGEIAGRRVAGRLLPYVGETGSLPFRFDPVERRFLLRKKAPTIAVGPADSEAWREAVARLPLGPVLIGPCSAAEEVWGAFRAAAMGALEAGRGVYVLDPEPPGVPEAAGASVVALCSWRPGLPAAAFPGLAVARAAGIAGAAVLPLLPGWTGEPEELDALIAAAASGGAVSATALIPWADGEGRRAIVEARAAVDPVAAERLFEVIHHGDWQERLRGRLGDFRAACARHGLATSPPRPIGRREPSGNSLAAGRFEERALLLESDEHRSAVLHAAVRWIDESGRDLSAVAREGNFRRVFPFSEELAREAEGLLRETR